VIEESENPVCKGVKGRCFATTNNMLTLAFAIFPHYIEDEKELEFGYQNSQPLKPKPGNKTEEMIIHRPPAPKDVWGV
jgi:hypothetical protein